MHDTFKYHSHMAPKKSENSKAKKTASKKAPKLKVAESDKIAASTLTHVKSVKTTSPTPAKIFEKSKTVAASPIKAAPIHASNSIDKKPTHLNNKTIRTNKTPASKSKNKTLKYGLIAAFLIGSFILGALATVTAKAYVIPKFSSNAINENYKVLGSVEKRFLEKNEQLDTKINEGKTSDIEAFQKDIIAAKEQNQKDKNLVTKGLDTLSKDYATKTNELVALSDKSYTAMDELLDVVYCKKEFREKVETFPQDIKQDDNEAIKKLYTDVNKLYTNELECYKKKGVPLNNGFEDKIKKVADQTLVVQSKIGTPELQGTLDGIQPLLKEYQDASYKAIQDSEKITSESLKTFKKTATELKEKSPEIKEKYSLELK
jgi:hypothetical protein